MGQTTKITISLPKELLSFINEIANERKISRSKVVSSCLEEFVQRRKAIEMEEGYKLLAEEHRQLAQAASDIAYEVVPEWK